MAKEIILPTESYRVKGTISLKNINTNDNGGLNREDGEKLLDINREKMSLLQEKLYAESKQGLIFVFQAMDAAGKDGCIKHVMTGLNPSGTKVTSFKAPNETELAHDYMWRVNQALPRRGKIAIFNRSHYEEVVAVRLHNYVAGQKLPDRVLDKNIWNNRFEQINNWEKYLYYQGFVMVKFFLHISKEEQRQRLLDRIYKDNKNWKFSSSDIFEREHWEDYENLYEDAINNTSTEISPWYVVPSDKKWFSRALVSQVVVETLEKMDPQIPELSKQQQEDLAHWKKILEVE